MNLDDASLFLDAMGDVQPLKSHTDVHWQPMRNLRTPARIDTLQLDNILSTGFLDIVPLSVPLEFRREGLQNGVTDKLRNGIYGHSRFCNTDFDDKLACLNLSGV
ncbi:hypothetical protein EQ249_12300 [Citrobacter freundii]|nr:hypothetical protein EQ249_12300 [Citrobacter freundii]